MTARLRTVAARPTDAAPFYSPDERIADALGDLVNAADFAGTLDSEIITRGRLAEEFDRLDDAAFAELLERLGIRPIPGMSERYYLPHVRARLLAACEAEVR